MKHDPMSELNARVARLEQEAAAPALTAAAIDARTRMESMTAQIMDKRRTELSARVGQRKREISSSDDSKESHPPVELSFRDRIEQIKTLLPADAELSIRDRIAAVEASIMNNSGDLETSSASEFAKSKNPLDDLTPEQIDALKQEKVSRENEKARADKAPEVPLDENGDPLAPGVKPEGLKVTPQAKGKYTAKTQPRDAQGQFRLVLARLKSDIGDAGLDKLLKKVEDTENLDHAGNYAGAVEASQDLLKTIDRLDSGALDATAIGNVRKSAGELGKVIANLPFNFENQAAKIRFSDVPPTLRDLMEQMIKRVEAKIGNKDAAIATQGLKSFMSGSDLMSQSDISTEMSKLLRLLT
jgi:hypothetical protein